MLDRIADLAETEKVDLVAVLGDIFEFARPEVHHILAFQAFVRRLNGAGIRVFCLVGNHDVRSAALPSAVEIFGETGCVVALQPSLYPVDDIVIAALPWTHPGNVVAAMPDADRSDVNDAAARGLAEAAMLMSLRCQTEFPTYTPLLVGHWAISGAALPTGLDASMLREPVVPLGSLQETAFALVAFGHIHKAQVVSAEPLPIVYTGSPQVNRWDEAEGEHGVWIWDSAPPGLLRFHVIADRPFLTLTPSAEELIAAPAMLEGVAVEGAVVRVAWTCTEEQARKIDQAQLRRGLLAAGAAKVVLRPTVERAVRARVAGMSDDLSEAAALELWIASQNGSLGCEPDALRAAHLEFVAKLGQA